MNKSSADKNGFILLTDIPVSKAGVYPYAGSEIHPSLEPNRIYQVYKPSKELSSKETIDSLKLNPWTIQHKMLGDKYTKEKNIKVEGTTGEDVYFKDNTLFTNLKVFGSTLKEAIKSGLNQLSLGVACVYVFKKGVSENGEDYDILQKDIRGNHLASLEVGRVGEIASIPATAMDQAIIKLDNLNFNNKGEDMSDLEKAKKEIERLKAEIKKLKEPKKGEAKDGKPEKGVDPFPDKNKEKDKDKKEDKDEKKGDSMDSGLLNSLFEEVKQLASQVESLSETVTKVKSTSMDSGSIIKMMNDKNNLANDVEFAFGKFSHQEMTIEEVAQHGVEKAGISCDSGSEVSALKGYFAGAKTKQKNFTVVNNSQDSAADKSYLEKI